MYKNNPRFYNGIFVVPSVLVDDYMKLVSDSMLKTILTALRHAYTTFDDEFIAEKAGLPVSQVTEALAFWCKEGLIIDCENEAVSENIAEPEAENGENEAQTEKKKYDISEKRTRLPRPGNVSYQQICTRLSESEEVKLLFNMSQEKLGRTIGTADQSALLNLYDYYGLPIEVILSLCHYATTHGKANNTNYIFSLGANFSDRDITTLEAVDEEFRRLEKISAYWPDFCKITGYTSKYPSASQEKYLNVWFVEWKFSFDVVAFAYEEMGKNTKVTSFPYMNKILANWHSKGLKSVEEIAEYQKNYAIEKEKQAVKKKPAEKPSAPYGVKTGGTQNPASYDLGKATELMNLTVPKYKKKEKR